MDFVDSLKNIKKDMIEKSKKETQDDDKEEKMIKDFFDFIKDSDIKKKN
ncbi:hypothetical protein [uncultured Campylobacter sp.]|nr:hypothetical protein [uncultured Campylobacter sp.]